jgi:DNA-binding winged helix-turn-helix (wHTH) protein
MKSAETAAARVAVPQLVVGDLQVNLRDRIVRRGSRRLPVSGRSFQLLQFLIERYPETATHRELLESVWGGVVVTADALSQRVRLLRKALGDELADEGYIVSVHGQGYRLSRAPVPEPGEDQVRARLANPRRVAWFAVVMAVALLLILLVMRTPHAFKHFVRHLL